jgi:hypothetical protein
MAANHNGAIVKRRLGIKNADKQIVAEFGIQPDAAIDYVFEADVAFDDD